ncbi:MAG: hypothetical protein ACRDDI_13580 [Aeromonas veronii]
MTDIVAAEMLRAVVTKKGVAAANQAATLGKPVKLTHVAVTGTPGTPNDGMESLPGMVGGLQPIADGKVISHNQVNVSTLLKDTFPTVDITGIAFYLEDGTLFSAYLSQEPLINHVQGATLLLGMDFVMDNIPSNSVVVESTGANLIMGDWVPVYRRVNGKALTADIMLNAADVNAAPSGFGLGEQQAYTVEDMNSDPTIWNGGGIGWFRGISTTANKPDNRAGVGIANRYQRGASSGVYIIYFAGHDIYTRYWAGSEWRDWSKSYSTTNKPTAADVGAVPLARKVNGKALDKDVTLTPADIGAMPADYRPDLSPYVLKTTTVNGQALDKNVVLSADDVGAARSSHDHSGYVRDTRKVNSKPLSSDINLNASDVGAVPTTRKVNNKPLDKDISLTAADVGALKQGDFGVGVKQGVSNDAASFTEDKTRDFDKLLTAGEFTISGDWANGVNGKAAAEGHTGIVKVEVRAFGAGPAYVQAYTMGNAAGKIRKRQRVGSGTYPSITWQPWHEFGSYEAELGHRLTINRTQSTGAPYIGLVKREPRDDLTSGWYNFAAIEMKQGNGEYDPLNPNAGPLAAAIWASRYWDNNQNRLVLNLRGASDGATKAEVVLYEDKVRLISAGKAADWNGKDFTIDGKKAFHEGFCPTASQVGAVPAARKVNNKALDKDISLSASDVGAFSQSGGALQGSMTAKGGEVRTERATNPLFEWHATGKHAWLSYVPDSGGLIMGSSNGAGTLAAQAVHFRIDQNDFRGRLTVALPQNRGWNDIGSAAFYAQQNNVSEGTLLGLVSGRAHFSGHHNLEHGYGSLSSASAELDAHVFWTTDGGNYLKYWQFRNGGGLISPSGWAIGSTGMLTGSCWGGSLDAWIALYYAQKTPSAHAVGSYIFAQAYPPEAIGHYVPGSTIAGQYLRACSCDNEFDDFVDAWLPGTWQCMGMAKGHGAGETDWTGQKTLWLRIA